jgi:hypothetical protein
MNMILRKNLRTVSTILNMMVSRRFTKKILILRKDYKLSIILIILLKMIYIQKNKKKKAVRVPLMRLNITNESLLV